MPIYRENVVCNEMEMKPRIETNSKTGSRCLICFYDPIALNWDKQIERAERRFNPKAEPLAVIALPSGRIGNDNKGMGRGANCNPNYKRKSED